MSELSFLKNNKHRALLVWVTDAALGFYSYFYLTGEKQFKSFIKQLETSGLDPETLQSPEFQDQMRTLQARIILITLLVFAVLHTISFYRYSIGKKVATTYVKFYSLSAALTLLVWLAFAGGKSNRFLFVPFIVFTLIALYEFFEAEKQN